VLLCTVGALALYLTFWRFHCTGEFLNFTLDNWLNNKDWFDIKLLIDVNGSNNTQEMKNDSYGKVIKRILKKLKVACNKLLYLGWNLGSKILDLLEEETEPIWGMGNWNNGIWDNAYSSKLPLGPIRKLAGFHTNKFYFNTRTSVEPPHELLLATLIGKFVYCSYEAVTEYIAEHGGHETCIEVLKFLMEMNRVLLQDVGAMQVLHLEECIEHPLFEVDVFQSEEFQVCQQLLFYGFVMNILI
jgi:hypothetical protein